MTSVNSFCKSMRSYLISDGTSIGHTPMTTI